MYPSLVPWCTMSTDPQRRLRIPYQDELWNIFTYYNLQAGGKEPGLMKNSQFQKLCKVRWRGPPGGGEGEGGGWLAYEFDEYEVSWAMKMV